MEFCGAYHFGHGAQKQQDAVLDASRHERDSSERRQWANTFAEQADAPHTITLSGLY